MSVVTVNEFAVRFFFEQQALRGASLPGLDRSANRIARRITDAAKRNASGEVVRRRTGFLADSLEPIVRTHARTGALEVGVGSTAPYAGYLEHGTSGGYTIRPVRTSFLVSAPGHPDPLSRPQRQVTHPGIEAKRFLQKAVDEVVGLGT